MLLEEFVHKKQTAWSELDALLNKIPSGNIRALSASELDRLGYLYRQVTSDLAIARRDFPHDRVVRYLNDLAARSHSSIYQAPPLKKNLIRNFFRFGFPQLFRENFLFMIIAFLLFTIAFSATYLMVLAEPEFGERLVSPRLVKTIKQKEMWTNIPEQQRNIASSFIMTNNIRVAFAAFALGITFTLGTVYILLLNGAHLGAVGALCQVHGLSLPLWSFVSPHGYIELTVIFIAGGAGLKMGYALIDPKLSTRKQALITAAKHAVTLLGGCVPLLVIAGTIEGFVSPSSLSPWTKILCGALSGMLLYSYLLLAKEPAKQPGQLKASTGPSAQDIC
jgi:uncharacterized membrane protein SpoIIM required for sporulation